MKQNTDVSDVDPRADYQRIEMTEWFDEERSEYADADGYTIVYEDDQVAVVADHTGHELNEWAERFGVDRERLRQTMRALAEDVIGEKDAHDAFSYSDPVVFDKFEDDD
jgi:ATP-dependent Clp protease ATP-binding subunit ClpA